MKVSNIKPNTVLSVEVYGCVKSQFAISSNMHRYYILTLLYIGWCSARGNLDLISNPIEYDNSQLRIPGALHPYFVNKNDEIIEVEDSNNLWGGTEDLRVEQNGNKILEKHLFKICEQFELILNTESEQKKIDCKNLELVPKRLRVLNRYRRNEEQNDEGSGSAETNTLDEENDQTTQSLLENHNEKLSKITTTDQTKDYSTEPSNNIHTFSSTVETTSEESKTSETSNNVDKDASGLDNQSEQPTKYNPTTIPSTALNTHQEDTSTNFIPISITQPNIISPEEPKNKKGRKDGSGISRKETEPAEKNNETEQAHQAINNVKEHENYKEDKHNEHMKSAVSPESGKTGEIKAASTRKDTLILVILFAAVCGIAGGAFIYNYYVKRKRAQQGDAESGFETSKEVTKERAQSPQELKPLIIHNENGKSENLPTAPVDEENEKPTFQHNKKDTESFHGKDNDSIKEIDTDSAEVDEKLCPRNNENDNNVSDVNEKK